MERRFLVIGSFDYKEPEMTADASRKAQLTAELLKLTQVQQKALEDATYLGWQPGQLEAYQDRGERISLLRQRLTLAIAEEKDEVSPGTPLIDPERSRPS